MANVLSVSEQYAVGFDYRDELEIAKWNFHARLYDKPMETKVDLCAVGWIIDQ